MEKLNTRFFLAAGLYLAGVCTALMGLLLAWVIPRGGQGQSTWLALARHDWADIHAVFALCFLALAIAHGVVNRTQLMAHLRKIAPTDNPKAMGAVAAAPIGLLVLAWLLALIF